jgi:hypothetical protein
VLVGVTGSNLWPLPCEASAATSPNHATPRFPAQQSRAATISGVALWCAVRLHEAGLLTDC